MELLVVDDQQLFVEGLRSVLMRLDSAITVHAARGVEHALAECERHQELDVVLLGAASLSHLNDHRLGRLVDRQPTVPVVVVSADDSAAAVRTVMDRGAVGLIPKTCSGTELIDALSVVMRGEIYLPVSARESHGLRAGTAPGHRPPQYKRYGLTHRQFEVLTLMAQGYSNKRIAQVLSVTEHTVKSHVRALFEAMDSSNRTQCVLAAGRFGLVALRQA